MKSSSQSDSGSSSAMSGDDEGQDCRLCGIWTFNSDGICNLCETDDWPIGNDV